MPSGAVIVASDKISIEDKFNYQTTEMRCDLAILWLLLEREDPMNWDRGGVRKGQAKTK